MKTIKLTQGKVTIVDDWHFAALNQFNWCALWNHGHWYAVRSTPRINGKHGILYMARIIMGVTDPMVKVDHRDRMSTLDNREANLRLATNGQNITNSRLSSRNTSGYRGVTWSKRYRKWCAAIRVHGMPHKGAKHLGYFSSKVQAAAVYNFAARRLHGEFAYQNDLSQVTPEQCSA